MRRLLQIALVVIVLLLLVVLGGPFLVPVPPLEETVDPRELADPDGRFVSVNGIEVHYEIAGEGEPALLLLHGFAASTFSWREVLEPLAEGRTVVAFDRPAFGLTGRPMPGDWEGESPYTLASQADLTVGLMDELGIERAVLVGNSAGGAVAVMTALRHPERVEALVLVDPAIFTRARFPDWLGPLLRTPQARRIGPLFMRRIRESGEEFGRSAWHDPSQFTEEIWEGYTRPLHAENWDRALWELVAAGQSVDLGAQLDGVRQPALVITGDDDRIVPPEQSIRVASELPNAVVEIIPECGHVPQEECPGPFLEAVREFLGSLGHR